MKQWFPFTHYDFYAYLACGFVLLFAADYAQDSNLYLFRDNWSFFDGVLLTAVAYVAGQIVAIPASTILEDCLARTVLRPPAVILLSSRQPWWERWIGLLLVGRYYHPLPVTVRDRVFANAEKRTGKSREYLKDHAEDIFLVAFSSAREIEDARRRMDEFRNQYGFNRNMALSALMATGLLFHKYHSQNDQNALCLSVGGALLSLGMFVRFLKFYSSFAAEVLRTFAFQEVANEN